MREDVFIACSDLSIGYPERSTVATVVKSGLTLRALKGEMVALIGGNGVGKSTLLKTIAGFQPPLSGEILIHHRPSSSYSSAELAKELSFVSTEMVRVPNLSVSELVGLGRFPYTNWLGQLNEIDKEFITNAICQVGLSGYEKRKVGKISDGERQRAMVARALAQDTPILVLDEPTAFLDISNKYEIVGILHKLAVEQGKCILFSTHDLNTALSIADRIWLMLDDRVVEGIPEELVSNGSLEALFPNNQHLYFDKEKGDFRIRKEKKGKVYLNASGKELIKATKALDRIGFEVITKEAVPNASLSVGPMASQTMSHPAVTSDFQLKEIYTVQHEKRWILSYSGIMIEIDSLEALCRELKGIMHQRES